MANAFLRKKSKRQLAKHRYKVEKKVRQHNKKLRREKRKNGSSKKIKKDPGIPNSLPFKESILKEAQERKQRVEEEQQKRKEKRKRDREKNLAKKRNLEGILKDAQKRTAEFEKKKAVAVAGSKASGKAVETSLKTFYKEFRKVVDAADVVLEVLDARDPLGSRCAQMEEAIISSGTNKRLVLILNKIDLVPRENVEAWLTHLRNEFPTIAFKASTQTQTDNLSQKKMTLSTVSDDLLKSSHCLGAELLMKLLGNYCRNKDIKSAIRVGVVGFPNTGKSSIINSLKRCKACNVGSQPGITRTMQEVQLDKHIKLLDSPGVVMATGASDMSVILRNCVKLESLQDPVGPVEAILKRCSKEQMMLHYKVPDYSNVNDFLALLAKRFGKLRKGGIPDVNKAAKTVLHDWTHGRITYYTQPPEQHSLPTHVGAAFVTEMGKEFSLDDLLPQEQKNLQSLESRTHKHMLVESLGSAKVVMSESDLDSMENTKEETEMGDVESEGEDFDFDESMEESSEMDEDSEDDTMMKEVTVSMETEKKSKKNPPKAGKVGGSAEKRKLKVKAKKAKAKSTKGGEQVVKEKLNDDLLQLNKKRKLEFKKMKKQRKRRDKVAGELSTALTQAFSFDMDS